MDVPTKLSAVVGKFLLISFALILVAMFLMNTSRTSSSPLVQGERTIENTIPKDVPLKIKIKKEKEASFRDMKNEKWAREFELEVTNTGEKPIYYLELVLITDVKAAAGYRIEFPLQYGRAELGDVISKPVPTDVPIKSGETYIFKIHPGQVPAWEQAQKEENRPQPKRIQVLFQVLSFGDGTGLFGAGGKPYPRVSMRQSRLNDRAKPPIKTGSGPTEGSRDSGESTSISNTPAKFLPANFLSPNFTKDRSSTEQILTTGSCDFEYCVNIVPWRGFVCYNCPNENRPGFDPNGICAELVSTSIECFVNGFRYISVRESMSTIVALDRERHRHHRQLHLLRRVAIAQILTPLQPTALSRHIQAVNILHISTPMS